MGPCREYEKSSGRREGIDIGSNSLTIQRAKTHRSTKQKNIYPTGRADQASGLLHQTCRFDEGGHARCGMPCASEVHTPLAFAVRKTIYRRGP